MSNDESYFNVSLIVRDKDSVHKPQPFWRKRGAEVESLSRAEALLLTSLTSPLGQTGSRLCRSPRSHLKENVGATRQWITSKQTNENQ